MDGWVPCDIVPVLYTDGGRLKLVKFRDLMNKCAIYVPDKHKDKKPKYAYIPHYYTCPVLKRERSEWAAAQRGM